MARGKIVFNTVLETSVDVFGIDYWTDINWTADPNRDGFCDFMQ